MTRAAAPKLVLGETQLFLDAHRHSTDGEVYGITDLVNEFGVTARAIRLYEQKGLLAPQRVGSARVFSRRDRARLSLILRAKALGSTLEEIKEYLDLYGPHGEGRRQQLEYVLRKIAAKQAELRQKRGQLDKMLAELELIQASCEQQLARRRSEGARR
jgi:DNA-binding transcriptional MerR regulator